MKYCRVAVDGPFYHPLTYSVPDELNHLQKGDIVFVPLRYHVAKGVLWEEVLELTDEEKELSLKEISINSDLSFTVPPQMVKLYEWVANYYHYPTGALFFDVIPSNLKVKKEKLKICEGIADQPPFELSGEQNDVVKGITPYLGKGFSKHLLHGITGSGKSVVYLELIKVLLKEERSILLLVPEINLTPQLLQFLTGHLTCPIYPYHSSLTHVERKSLWRILLRESGPKVIVGARSSIFLPIDQLGLIIIDEEHDGSYKQDDHCTYHARDVAIKRAQIEQIPIIMGSATPSVENFYQYRQEKEGPIPQKLWILNQRIGEAHLPQIECINMQGVEQGRCTQWPFALKTVNLMKSALDQRQQVIVFVNRLGYAHYIQCQACGYQLFCQNCSIKLRYFQNKKKLSCHFCQYTIPLPYYCPKCQCMQLVQKGFGTEKVLSKLENFFPLHKVARFDRDEIINLKQLEERLEEFHQHKIDILVGTQMLAKGHNFKRVNLVVILGVDEQLSWPDFRSQEKLYQLVMQIAGRAGRYAANGHVVIQTHNPDEPVFDLIRQYAQDDFYKQELSVRELLSYPPFSRLAVIYLTGKVQAKVQEISEKLAFELKYFMTQFGDKTLEILGAGPALTVKKLNQYTWQILVRSKDVTKLHQFLKGIEKINIDKSVFLKIEVDPIQFS